MARSMKRGWMKVYEIYGVQEAGAVAGLIWQALAFGIGTEVLWWYFTPCTKKLALTVSIIPYQVWGFVLGFIMGIMALLTLCFVVTAANLVYTNVVLRYRMARRMVGMVEDWSKVESVLDVGCGSGLLLNTVALRLKKEGCGGRVVGVDLWLNNKGGSRTMAGTLKTSSLEGTQEYVTCKSGDARNLPFTDNYFNVVVSATCLNNLGEELGRATSAAAEQRRRGLEEIVRVLRPGGQAIIWDLSYGPQYARTLKELDSPEDWSLYFPDKFSWAFPRACEWLKEYEVYVVDGTDGFGIAREEGWRCKIEEIALGGKTKTESRTQEMG